MIINNQQLFYLCPIDTDKIIEGRNRQYFCNSSENNTILRVNSFRDNNVNIFDVMSFTVIGCGFRLFRFCPFNFMTTLLLSFCIAKKTTIMGMIHQICFLYLIDLQYEVPHRFISFAIMKQMKYFILQHATFQCSNNHL